MAAAGSSLSGGGWGAVGGTVFMFGIPTGTLPDAILKTYNNVSKYWFSRDFIKHFFLSVSPFKKLKNFFAEHPWVIQEVSDFDLYFGACSTKYLSTETRNETIYLYNTMYCEIYRKIINYV